MRIRALLLSAALLSICFAQDLPQSSPNFPDRLLAATWPARWITYPGASRSAGVYHFRKTLTLASRPSSFVIFVSADNRFRLYVNSKRVGEGPARGDLYHWRFERFDIAPFLQVGENVLAATVWNFATFGPVAQMTDQTGFLVEGELEKAANTDSSWMAESETGDELIRFTSSQLHGYYAAGPGEQIIASRYDWNWASRTTVTQRWRPAEQLTRAASRGSQDAPNAWMLIPDELPPMTLETVSAGRVVRQSGTQLPAGSEVAAVTIPAGAHVSILLDTGALQTAYPELTVSAGAGSRVRLTYAEALINDNGEKGNRNEITGKHIRGYYDELLPDGASGRTFMPLWWRTWRYLQLDIDTAREPLTINRLSALFSAYPFQQRARFDSPDSELARMWEVGCRTARLCAHETYMDCPYWEQLQYVGDTRIQALISYVMTGDDRLARQAIDAINRSRMSDGITQSRFPSELPQYIPPFSLMWVGMVHDFWWYRDDPVFVASQLGGTRTVLDWFLHFQRPDGLLGLLPWWDFVDWTSGYRDGVPPQDADGGSSALTLQLIEALRDAADLESQFGDNARASMYRQRADEAADALRRLCWNSQYGLLADTPAQKKFSEQPNILAVWLDVIDKDQQEAVIRKILSGESGGRGSATPELSRASYYFRFYLARALEHAGLADEYLNLLGPWRNMLALGLTTWAETPEPTRSDCHAWSAHPNFDLLSIVAGIRPGSPGFGTVLIEPHLGYLKSVSVVFPHEKGTITAAYAVEPAATTADITLPPALTGELVWNGRHYTLHAGQQTLTLP